MKAEKSTGDKRMRRNKKNTVCLLLTIVLLMSPLLATMPQPVQAQELPVPREQSVIISMDNPYIVFDSFNNFIPNGVQWGGGWHQAVNEWDWYINYFTGEVIYWRITGWEYEDDYTTFIMHIRKGVKWNDGEPYTANDIAFTYNMLQEHEDLSGHDFVDEWVESIEAPDDYTAVIHLKKKNSRFHHNLRMWGGPAIAAEHIWEDEDPTTFKNNPPIETGPWELYQVLEEQQMFIWVRDDDYWAKDVFGQLPAPKYMIWKYFAPADIELEQLVNGEIDAPQHLTWDLMKTAMERTPDVVVATATDPCTNGLQCINHKRYPLSVREFRWAIAYCVDREAHIAIYPDAEVTWPAYLPYSNWPSFAQYDAAAARGAQRIKDEYGWEHNVFDPTKAAEILDSIDFIDRDNDGIRETPNGTVCSIELFSSEPPSNHYLYATDLADELTKIGVDATVRTGTGPALAEMANVGDFDINTGGLCSGMWTTGDIVGMLDQFHSKNYRPIGEPAVEWFIRSRAQIPEMDAIVDELWSLDPDDDWARYEELAEEGLYHLMLEIPMLSIVEAAFSSIRSTKYWTGWPSTDNMWQVPFLWWPTMVFILNEIKPVSPPVPVTTTVTDTVTDVVTETTTETQAAETVTETETVTTLDMTTLAGAGIVALIVGVLVGWLVGSRRS